MSASTAREKLPKVIGWTAALTNHWHLLLQGKRKDFIIFAGFAVIVFVIAAFNVKIPVLHGVDAERGVNLSLEFFSETDFGLPQAPGLIAFLASYLILLIASVGWALGLWCPELPRNRGYMWSLPVKRGSNHVARVAAGGIWLMGGMALLAGAALLGLLAGGRMATISVVTPDDWINFATGPMTLYLLASIAGVLSDRPVRAFFLGYGVILVPYILFGILDVQPLFQLWDHLNNGPFGSQTALAAGFKQSLSAGATGAFPFEWLSAALLWLALGVGGVTAAAYRYQER
jgi:hypothetical protein